MTLFLKGLIVGIAISVPMGSVGILVVHRIVAHNKISALFVCLGSLIADSIFGIIAIYGLSTLSTLINNHKAGLSLFGGAMLLIVALNIFFSKPKEKVEYDFYYTLPKDFITGFILTITNPLTVLAVLGLFAWFGLNGAADSIILATTLFLGLLSGLMIWWLSLIEITHYFKEKIRIPQFKIVNRTFGLILFILAILVLNRVL